MADPIFDSGNFAIMGWADQALYGTPVVSAHYVAGQQGTFEAPFNPDLQPVSIMSGSLNQDVAMVTRKGTATWKITSDFFQTLNTDFLGKCGVGATITQPSRLTLSGSGKMGAFQYPSAFADTIRIHGDAATGAVIDYSGVYHERPVPISALAVPSLTGEDPYTWEDFIQMTLLTGAASIKDVESIDITISLPRALGYGNSGVALPNISVLNGVKISGTIVLYMNDTNVAEYNAGIAKDGTAGGLVFGWDKVATGTKKSLFTLGHIKYTTPRLTYPKDGIDLVTLGFGSYSPTLANQLVFAQTTNS
jgi:hypothetical protein